MPITEREIKKTIPFTIVSKGIKYLRINLTKDVNLGCRLGYRPVLRKL